MEERRSRLTPYVRIYRYDIYLIRTTTTIVQYDLPRRYSQNQVEGKYSPSSPVPRADRARSAELILGRNLLPPVIEICRRVTFTSQRAKGLVCVSVALCVCVRVAVQNREDRDYRLPSFLSLFFVHTFVKQISFMLMQSGFP